MEEKPRLGVQPTDEGRPLALNRIEFCDSIYQRDYQEMAHKEWRCRDAQKRGLPAGATLVRRLHFQDQDDLLFDLGDSRCRLVRDKHSIDGWVAAHSAEELEVAWEAIRSEFPIAEPDEENRILPIKFRFFKEWARQRHRQIEVPAWEDIRANYSAQTRRGIERTIHSFHPNHWGG